MNTREVAEKLGTDPKKLRRFLRGDATYRNAGQGGRYEFTEKDLPTLRKRFDAYVKNVAKQAASSSRPPRAPRGSDDNDGSAMDVSIANKPAHKLSPKERERRDRLSRERVDRLEQRLLATGNHISQLRSVT